MWLIRSLILFLIAEQLNQPMNKKLRPQVQLEYRVYGRGAFCFQDNLQPTHLPILQLFFPFICFNILYPDEFLEQGADLTLKSLLGPLCEDSTKC